MIALRERLKKRPFLFNIYRYTIFTIEIFLKVTILIASPFVFAFFVVFHWLSKRKDIPTKSIVIGVNEIANNIYTTGNAFRNKGYKVYTVSVIHPFYQKNSYDFILPPRRLFVHLKKAMIFFKLINKSNKFLYFSHHTFLPYSLDFVFLKLLRKQLIVQHCGSDVRYHPIQRKLELKSLGDTTFSSDELRGIYFFVSAMYTQRIAEWLRIPIITLRDQATFQTRPAYHFFFPQEKALDNHKQPKQTPLIIHAPSDKKIKKTDIVLEAIKKLQAEGLDFEFELIYKKPNKYTLERIKEADIVIDQPNSWPARVAVEAMAASCVVVGGNRTDYHQINISSPILQFKPDANELAETLRHVICDQALRAKKMQESFDFWKKYYSEERYVSYLESIYAGDNEPKLMPLPDFKKQLITFADSFYQRALIKLFL